MLAETPCESPLSGPKSHARHPTAAPVDPHTLVGIATPRRLLTKKHQWRSWRTLSRGTTLCWHLRTGLTTVEWLRCFEGARTYHRRSYFLSILHKKKIPFLLLIMQARNYKKWKRGAKSIYHSHKWEANILTLQDNHPKKWVISILQASHSPYKVLLQFRLWGMHAIHDFF